VANRVRKTTSRGTARREMLIGNDWQESNKDRGQARTAWLWLMDNCIFDNGSAA
jgi:hypothetical protein